VRAVRERKTRYLSLALIAVTYACQDSIGSEVPIAVAVVRGVVSDASGNPVVSAAVGANNFLDPCPTDASALGIVDTRTNASGAYRIEIPTLVAPGIECIAVTVTPVGGASTTVAGARVQFKPQGMLPYDSVVVDVVIP
jgi:hypothetical protein